MNRLAAILPYAAAVAVAVLVLGATFAVARVPGAVLGDAVVPSPAAVPSVTPGTVAYTLKEGRTASQVGDDLAGLGVISSSRQFGFLVRLMGLQEKLSAGDYDLVQGMSAVSAIDAIAVKDSVPVLRVTFPEGIRVEEMAVRAERAGIGTEAEFMAAVKAATPPPAFAASLPAGAGLQGYLFPDTYIVPTGTTSAELVDRMLQTLAVRFTPEMIAAAAAEGLTPHQVLTLASIVEREAVVPEERPLIAGVFMNRLAAGDMLGADPTVQFAVAADPASVAKFGWWKRDLTLEDLKIDSPYNTRLKGGLPPGPIANPGLDSIKAAVHPTATDYYYFVADAKKADGSHVFAKTLAEHTNNIATVGTP